MIITKYSQKKTMRNFVVEHELDHDTKLFENGLWPNKAKQAAFFQTQYTRCHISGVGVPVMVISIRWSDNINRKFFVCT